MALPENTTHISDMATTNEITPEDYVPIIRPDGDTGSFGNFKTKTRNFVSYPMGYLEGGVLTVAGSTCKISKTYCRDSQGLANIFIEQEITKQIDGNLFYPNGVPSASGTFNILVARKSEADPSSTFFLSSSTGGQLGSDWAYSRSVGRVYFNKDSLKISNIFCYDNEIVVVQEGEITPGVSLESGKIALVIEPLN